MTAVTTLYGTFDEDDLKSIYDSLSEISIEMTKIESHKEAIRDIIGAMHDAHNIPKKVLNRLAKTHHKNTFETDVAEDNEFEALYTGLTEVK
jgi:hypothetical protein